MHVDLRSDTVTKPTPEMYKAMAEAELGDDVLGDDPTVKALENLAAEKLGKEASVFVPSGTMGNQIGIRSWVKPGDAILVEAEAHIVYNESGGPGAISGVVTWTIPGNRGIMEPDEIRSRITVESIHTPGTKLLCLENTHNRAGGAVIPLELMRTYRSIADEHGLKIHLDGARIFNAAISLGVEASEIAQYADSVMFCLSKGLSCPIGSMLVGTKEYIETARIHRKRMGGGMRQAGILAACGIYALNHLVERLAEDHRRAKEFAKSLSGLPGISVAPEEVQTNIVMIKTNSPAQEWQMKLWEKGVWCLPSGKNRLRCVFHRNVDDHALHYAIEAFQKIAC